MVVVSSLITKYRLPRRNPYRIRGGNGCRTARSQFSNRICSNTNWNSSYLPNEEWFWKVRLVLIADRRIGLIDEFLVSVSGAVNANVSGRWCRVKRKNSMGGWSLYSFLKYIQESNGKCHVPQYSLSQLCVYALQSWPQSWWFWNVSMSKLQSQWVLSLLTALRIQWRRNILLSHWFPPVRRRLSEPVINFSSACFVNISTCQYCAMLDKVDSIEQCEKDDRLWCAERPWQGWLLPYINLTSKFLAKRMHSCLPHQVHQGSPTRQMNEP